MKYYSFEKIVKGENPIIRITYKTIFGKLVVRDVCKGLALGHWVFMDDDQLTFRFGPINNFFLNEDDYYLVNGGDKEIKK